VDIGAGHLSACHFSADTEFLTQSPRCALGEA
jgi:hypothetical protein